MVDLNKMLPSDEINQKIKEETDNIKSDIEKLENEKLENKDLEYEKLPQELYDSGWFLDKNELLIAYNYRPSWWYEDDNPRMNDEFYYSVVKESDMYELCWKTKEEGSTKIYPISPLFRTKKFITLVDDDRNRKLGQNAKNGDLPRNKKTIVNFFDSLIPLLNKYDIEQKLQKNYIVMSEKDVEETGKRYDFETFSDYPEDVQKEANKILRENKFFSELLDSISWKHEGDRETAILLLLSCGSIFIGEPVHQLLNTEKGGGKTNIFFNVREVIPEQYIMDLRTFSNKFLYYNAENLNPKYNILFIDDVPLNGEKIELLKEISDNNQKRKVLKTLIDQKIVEFELPGFYLSLLNRAKSDMDPELGDRHYINSLEGDKGHANKVKNKILENSLRNQDEYLNRKRFILKACYQKLIDNEVKIYNPYLVLFNVMEHGNRNISHYTGFIKANTFYTQENREKINDIIIGSFEDMNSVLTIISENFKKQKYKIDNDESKIIEHLKENPEKNSYKEIAKAIEISTALVKHKINGRDNMMGLETKGLVEKEYIDPETPQKGVMIHLISDDLDDSNVKNTLVTLDTIQDEEKDVPLILKWIMVISFLEWLQILINNIVVSKLKILLKKEEVSDLYNYNNIILLLEKSLKEIEDSTIYIQDTDNYTLEDLNFHNDFIQNKFKKFLIFISENSDSVTTEKNSSKQKLFNDIETTKDTQKSIHCNQQNKGFEKEINQDVLNILVAKDDLLISEIIKQLPTYDKDQDTNFFIINQVIKELAINGKITIYNNKITKKKSLEIFQNLIFKLLNNGKSYTSEELAEAIPDISPDLESTESRLEKIEDLTKKGLLFLSDNQLVMSDDLKNIFRGDSK